MKNSIPADLNSLVNIGICESISRFDLLYGKKYHFEKQKILFNIMNSNIPNNGYKTLTLSNTSQDIQNELVEKYDTESEWEEEFLFSWKTDIPTMSVLSAELLEKDGAQVWYVIYSLNGSDCIYISTCQYRENFKPKTQVITYSF